MLWFILLLILFLIVFGVGFTAHVIWWALIIIVVVALVLAVSGRGW